MGEFDAVFVPVGEGGLLCGLALALRAMGSKRVVACEVETAAPLTASRRAGRPVSIERIPSFVDGIGGGSVFPQMWPLLQELVSDVLLPVEWKSSIAMRLLVRRTAVAEGAGAASLAAALSGRAGGERVVAVISGGNIDPSVFGEILTSRD